MQCRGSSQIDATPCQTGGDLTCQEDVVLRLPCLEPKQRYSGHSLIEMMVALPLMTVIIVAAGSLISAASHSRNSTSNLLDDKLQTLDVCQRLLNEVQFASSIAQHLPNTIEFTATDRNQNNRDDQNRYSWSGVAGDPLLVSRDNQVATVFADNVHLFSLAFETVTDMTATVIKAHDDAIAGTVDQQAIEPGKPACQYLLPNLPDDATAWNLDRVRLVASSAGNPDGVMLVQLTAANGSGQPTAPVYEEMKLSETQLDQQPGWVDVKFWNVSNLNPADGICIVLKYLSGTDSAGLVYFERDGSNMTPDTHWITSSNDGLTWSLPKGTHDLRFYLLGTHNGTPIPRLALKAVRLTLQIGSDTQLRSESTVRLLNEPELAN